MSRKIIGIDLGTTSISGVVLDTEEKQVLEKQTIPGGRFLESDYKWERAQDAEEIVKKAICMTDTFLEQFPDIERIGIDCQMHGILYLAQEGNAVSPLFTWQDGRGEERQENGMTMVQEIFEKTGEKTASGYGLVTHLYNLKHGLVPKQAAVLCTIGDYLAMKLTGKQKPVMHISNAASLGLFDNKSGRFYKEKLNTMGMDTTLLPEVRTDFDFLGTYKKRKVAIAIGDNQASFLGAVGLEKEKVLVNIGTGSQVSILTDQYVEISGMDTRPVLKNQWLLVGASLCGGRAYALLESFFRSYEQAGKIYRNAPQEKPVEEQYALMGILAGDAMKKRTAGMENVLKVSTLFSGTRENPAQRGSITGISTENFTPGEMILGTMEGMIQELWEMYEKIAASGVSASEVIMSGNGIRRNEILQQLIGKRFALPYMLSPYAEEAACGAAVSAVYSL